MVSAQFLLNKIITMSKILISVLILYSVSFVLTYKIHYQILDLNAVEEYDLEDQCKNLGDDAMVFSTEPVSSRFMNLKPTTQSNQDNITSPEKQVSDPMELLMKSIDEAIIGTKDLELKYKPMTMLKFINNEETKKDRSLDNYVSGNALRGERFKKVRAAHMPYEEILHKGHCRLEITKDYLQTALNAFALFLFCNTDDIQTIPAWYILKSARTIATMRLPMEKFYATWYLVKGHRKPEEVTFEELEQYRPLFKYVSGEEIAKLNLSDFGILSYIGTHAELNRHQVGVVASRYIKLNPQWAQSRYMNLMNNLLCGVPMSHLRRIPKHTFLQLNYQVFYHITACDPLQRRFYLNLLTSAQILGKPYSWTTRDVARLGLLLVEVDGPSLAQINPEALSGITYEVVSEMRAENLKYLTPAQRRRIPQRPRNILGKTIKTYLLEREYSIASMKLVDRYLILLIVSLSFSKY